MKGIKIAATIENKVRPCIVGNHTKALFHCWSHKPDTTVGIVEYSNGTVHETYPSEIRFVDNWVDEFHEHL